MLQENQVWLDPIKVTVLQPLSNDLPQCLNRRKRVITVVDVCPCQLHCSPILLAMAKELLDEDSLGLPKHQVLVSHGVAELGNLEARLGSAECGLLIVV